MAHRTTVTHLEAMAFDVELEGHHFKVDADTEFGGRDAGPKPKALLLSALAGCTGMDVVSILGKMKQQWQEFRLEVSGELGDDHPQTYKKILVKYIFKAAQLDRTKVAKAVNLSLDKYCGVAAMLRKSAAIEFEIMIE